MTHKIANNWFYNIYDNCWLNLHLVVWMCENNLLKTILKWYTVRTCSCVVCHEYKVKMYHCKIMKVVLWQMLFKIFCHSDIKTVKLIYAICGLTCKSIVQKDKFKWHNDMFSCSISWKMKYKGAKCNAVLKTLIWSVLTSLVWWVHSGLDIIVLISVSDGSSLVLTSLIWWVYSGPDINVLMGTVWFWHHCFEGSTEVLTPLFWWVQSGPDIIVLMGSVWSWHHWSDGSSLALTSLIWWVQSGPDIIVLMGPVWSFMIIMFIHPLWIIMLYPSFMHHHVVSILHGPSCCIDPSCTFML